MGKQWKQWQILFSWTPKLLQTVTAAMKLRRLLIGRKGMTNLDSILKSRDITLLMKVHLVKAMVFPVVRYVCWELDHKEGWTLKHWCFWAVVLEETLESPLDCKEIKPVNTKGNQHWILIGRVDTENEAPILWPPDVKSWLIRQDPDAGKYLGQEEKGVTEDEMGGWHYWLNGHEFEQIHTQISLIAQLAKNPPAIQETRLWFLDQKNPLEKG